MSLSYTGRRRKLVLSLHQKQMRFFTRLSVVVYSLSTLALLWFLNRPGLVGH